MKKYLVVIARSAETDIIESFLWGCEFGGVDEAHRWALDLRKTIEEKLRTFPRKYPVAPDDDHSGREYRNLFIGRYRVVYQIEGLEVRVLHVGGPFVDQERIDLGVSE